MTFHTEENQIMDKSMQMATVEFARSIKRELKLGFTKFRERQTYSRVLEASRANETIAKLIDSSNPALIARFGATEMRVVKEFEQLPQYTKGTMEVAERNSGIFPPQKPLLDRFSQLYTTSMVGIDMLGIWYVDKEAYCIKNFCPNAYLCNLADIEPYYDENPWSSRLADKRVLVVHPFAETMKKNYESKRELLFKDSQVLPKFDLQVYRAVQSLAGNQTPFKDWFEAYKFMCNGIAKLAFDIAIVGCGAYGLPIASFIKKEMGKTAVHMGGATQILFGIKGKRWDDKPFFRDCLYNEHWLRVSEKEKIKNYKIVEDGAYW
ncbi:MAG: GT-D fold domain-containing protein [Nostoc sp.]